MRATDGKSQRDTGDGLDKFMVSQVRRNCNPAPLPPADFLTLARAAALCAADGAYARAVPGHGQWRYVGEMATMLAANLAGLAALAESTQPGVAA